MSGWQWVLMDCDTSAAACRQEAGAPQWLRAAAAAYSPGGKLIVEWLGVRRSSACEAQGDVRQHPHN